MLVRFGAESISVDWPLSVASIGTFDGVHLGHSQVIASAVRKASALDQPAVVVTFDRHPMAVLAPERCPPAVGTLDLNLRAFEALGVSLAVVLKFDRALSQMPADDFLEQILKSRLRTSNVVIGHDFAFGQGRQGTPQWLASHIPTEIVPPFKVDGERVSSSRIREAIHGGDFELASKLLGRTWMQEGVVVGGQKLGRSLGYPTINLAATSGQAIPADGIYAGTAETRFGTFKAAISVGIRPTLGLGPRTIEAFLIDYPGESLYGTDVRLGYLRRLREERKFDSLEALKEQMDADVAEAARTE
jgi:riboflavin kinase/FMN adenylyltransferase